MTSVRTVWSALELASEALEVRLLGLVDFESAMFLQERLVYEISGREDTFGGLLICEHPPLVTVGREGSRAELVCEPSELTARQIDVRWLNRGGSAVVHAPGQLAIYPVVPLQRLGFGLAEYRRRLESAVLEMCRELRVPAFRDDVRPGVWSRSGQFGFLGIAVKSWVAYHGLFLNVANDLNLSQLVRPRGGDGRITSLSAQSMRSVTMSTVRESLVRHVSSQLGYDRYHLYTGHPGLKRTKRTVYAYS